MKPHTAQARKLLLLSLLLIIPAAIILVDGVLDPMRLSSEDTQTRQSMGAVMDRYFIARSTYYYRRLKVHYEDVAVSCLFGELCIQRYEGSKDSLQIRWEKEFGAAACPIKAESGSPAAVGLDTTLEFVNSVGRSLPFTISPETELSMFRMIEMWTEQVDNAVGIADTIVWIMELGDQATGRSIATIDSVGICRNLNLGTNGFPEQFGFSGKTSAETVIKKLGMYAQSNNNVFVNLRLLIRSPSRAVRSYGILDERNVNVKYSEQIYRLLETH